MVSDFVMLRWASFDVLERGSRLTRTRTWDP